MSYLKNLIRTTGNEFASIVEEGVAAADVSGYIDTGSYIFNALLSGSIYDGLPDNKITALEVNLQRVKHSSHLECVNNS